MKVISVEEKAIALFSVVKAINRLRRQQEKAPAPPPEPSRAKKLLTEIRDLPKR